MLYNPISSFPDKVDEMTFFQDISLDKKEIMDTYDALVAQKRYTEASEYMDQQSGIFGYFADFFNLLENRIYQLQDHILQKEKENPFVSTTGTTEPTTITKNMIWT